MNVAGHPPDINGRSTMFLRILYHPKHCQPGLKGMQIGQN